METSSKKVSPLLIAISLAVAALLVYGEIQTKPHNRQITLKFVAVPKYVRLARTYPAWNEPLNYKQLTPHGRKREVHLDKRMGYLYTGGTGVSSTASKSGPRISEAKIINTFEKSFREALKESLQRKVSGSMSKNLSQPQVIVEVPQPTATIVLEESEYEVPLASPSNGLESTWNSTDLILAVPETEDYAVVDMDQPLQEEQDYNGHYYPNRQGDWDPAGMEGGTLEKYPLGKVPKGTNHFVVPIESNGPDRGTSLNGHPWQHAEGPRPMDHEDPQQSHLLRDEQYHQRPPSVKAPDLGYHTQDFKPSMGYNQNYDTNALQDYEKPIHSPHLDLLHGTMSTDDISLDRLFRKVKTFWHAAKTKVHAHFLDKHKGEDAYDKSQKVLGKSISVLALVSFMIYIVAILFQWIIATMSFPLLTSIVGLVSGGGLNQVLDLIGRRRRQQPPQTVILTTTPSSVVEEDDFIELERKISRAIEFFDF